MYMLITCYWYVRCPKSTTTLLCKQVAVCRTPLHDWSLACDIVFTSCQYYANSIGYPPESMSSSKYMSGSPVTVLAGFSLLGRWLLPRVRQHSAHSAVSWHFDLRDAANTRQLRWQNFCSRWTSLVELSSGPAVQSRQHLRPVQTTAEGTPFLASMNAVLCDFWYVAPWRNTYLTYLLSQVIVWETCGTWPD